MNCTTLDIQGGELKLDGKTPTEYGFPSWRAAVGRSPQVTEIFSGLGQE